MNYVSFLFLIYVTAACLAYFLFPVVFRKFRSCQWIVLLIASWMFYLLCAGKYFFFLLVTSWTVYLGAQLLQKQADLQHQALSGEKKLGREEKKGNPKGLHEKEAQNPVDSFAVEFRNSCFFQVCSGLDPGSFPWGEAAIASGSDRDFLLYLPGDGVPD